MPMSSLRRNFGAERGSLNYWKPDPWRRCNQLLGEGLHEDRASRTAVSSALAILGAVKGNWLATWLRLQIRLARVREDLVQLELARLHERFLRKRA